MASLKGRLSLTSTAFRQNLVLLLVSRPSKEKDLRHVVHQAIDCHKIMEAVHEDQSQADEMILQLSMDYILQVKAAQEVLSRRRFMQHEVERAKSMTAKKSKPQSAANSGAEGGDQEGEAEEAAEEEGEDEDEEESDEDEGGESETGDDSTTSQKSGTKEMRKMQKRFNTVSQTIRRELEHFDVVMKEEFEEAFSSYNFRYFKAMPTSPKTSRRSLKSAPPMPQQAIKDHSAANPQLPEVEELE